MSRELGWKQFQTDESESASPDDEVSVPSYLGQGVRAPLPWGAPVAPPAQATPPNATPETVGPPAKANPGPPRSLRVGELIWFGLALVDAFLALDFLFRALAAHDSGFIVFVTRVGNALANPFVGVLNRPGVPRVDHTTYWAALVAIVIYTIAAWMVIQLLRVVAAPAPRVPPS